MMGWTFQNRDRGESHFDFFSREFNAENDNVKHEVLAAAGTLRTVYIALQVSHKQGSESFVFCVVCLTDWRKEDYFNFGYKDMSEEMGLNNSESHCPRRILDLLSPPEAIQSEGSGLDNIREWRQQCEENLAKAKQLRVTTGALIRTAKPVPFANGREYDTFLVVNAKRLQMTAFAENSYGRMIGTDVRFRDRRFLQGAEVVGCEFPQRTKNSG